MADEPNPPPGPPPAIGSPPPASAPYDKQTTIWPEHPQFTAAEWHGIVNALAGSAKTTSAVEPAATKEKDDEAKQKWWLRYMVAAFVLWTLWMELVGIYVLVMFQGFQFHDFKLNDWLFGALLSGVLVQTVWCLQAIASHLFPDGEGKLKERPKDSIWK